MQQNVITSGFNSFKNAIKDTLFFLLIPDTAIKYCNQMCVNAIIYVSDL